MYDGGSLRWSEPACQTAEPCGQVSSNAMTLLWYIFLLVII